MDDMKGNGLIIFICIGCLYLILSFLFIRELIFLLITSSSLFGARLVRCLYQKHLYITNSSPIGENVTIWVR